MHRVVVTGLGAITPIGNDVNTFWKSIKDNKHGIAPITYFDTSKITVSLAAEVKDFDPSLTMNRKEFKRMDPFSQFAVAASVEALEQSGFEINDDNAMRVGTIYGTGVGGFQTIEAGVRKLDSKGPKRISPLFVPMAIANMSAGNVAMHTGARGTSMSLTTACASGTNSVGEAFLKIQAGLLDACFAGGSEAAINEIAVSSFANLTALSNSDDPDKASRPFDKDRDGFVLGEGAGVLFLESLESAQARGANILAEIVGYGTNSDAYHMTAPIPDGSGAGESMLQAMEMASVKPEEIDYINAHGTGTPTNDTAETKSVKYALGEYAYQVPMSSTKGHTGHMVGTAGSIEAIVLVKALQEGYIPATIGLTTPDEECDLDYVPGEGRTGDLQYVMSNSLGFGGHNATILIKRWDGE